MTTAHSSLEQMLEQGSALFPQTELAHDHSAVERRVRRARAVRTTTASLATVGIAGALAFGASRLEDPSLPFTPAHTPSVSPSIVELSLQTSTLNVTEGRRIEEVAGALGAATHVSRVAAYAALIRALPPEADGDPEGWVAAEVYEVDRNGGVDRAAELLVGSRVNALQSHGIPREQWKDTVVLASIAAVASSHTDAGPQVARVLINRLAAGMPLESFEVLNYQSADTWALVGAKRPDRAGYNTFTMAGLPVGGIGAFTDEQLGFVVDPVEGDWLYYFVNNTRQVELFSDEAAFDEAKRLRGSL